MPKFELLVDPPRYIRDINSCEQATVRARYVHKLLYVFVRHYTNNKTLLLSLFCMAHIF